MEIQNNCLCSPDFLQLLPPEHQEAAEKREIERQLRERGFHDIEIHNTGKHAHYLVIADGQKVKASIHYLPLETRIMGPARFEVIFDDMGTGSNGH